MNLLLPFKEGFLVNTMPKCACDTLRWWWFLHTHKGIEYHYNAEPEGWDFTIHRHVEALLEDSHYEAEITNLKYNAPCITVIRNPLRRVVSAYYDKISNKNNVHFYKPGLTIVRWLEQLHKNRRRSGMWDNHFKPQSKQLTDIGKEQRYVRLEYFNVDLPKVLEDIDIEVPRFTNWKKNTRNYKGDALGYLSGEAKALAEDIYADDMKLWEEVHANCV